MICQLREYKVRPGEMREWVDEWSRFIVPLRRRLGFQVLGAWTIEEDDRFIWIVGYNGPKTWEEADRAYYESPQRKALDPNPARHLAETGARLMLPVSMP